MRRLARWAVRLLVAAALLVVVVALVAWLASDARWAHEVVRSRILAALAGAVEGDVSVARTSGRLGRTPC